MRQRRLFKSGNSVVLSIPQDILHHRLGLSAGDNVWIETTPNGFTVSRPPTPPTKRPTPSAIKGRKPGP